MKTILIIISILAATGTAGGADFRSISWGMSLQKVLHLEQGKARIQLRKQAPGMLVYDAEIAERAVRLTYLFRKNRLRAATYSIANADQALFQRLKGDLARRFKPLAKAKAMDLAWALDLPARYSTCLQGKRNVVLISMGLQAQLHVVYLDRGYYLQVMQADLARDRRRSSLRPAKKEMLLRLLALEREFVDSKVGKKLTTRQRWARYRTRVRRLALQGGYNRAELAFYRRELKRLYGFLKKRR